MNELKKKELLKSIRIGISGLFAGLIITGLGIIGLYVRPIQPIGILIGIMLFLASLYYIISSLIKLARHKEDSSQK